MVVLGGDQHECIGGGDHLAPVLGVLVAVVVQAGVLGFIEQRQVELGEIGQCQIETAMLSSALLKPASYRQADAARPRTAENDHEVGHRIIMAVASGAPRGSDQEPINGKSVIGLHYPPGNRHAAGQLGPCPA